MPFIVNVPRYALQNGDHKYASPCVLIQITDPGTDFIKPFHEFVEIYRFEFFDIDGTETGVLS